MDEVDSRMVEAEREATRRYSGAWQERAREREHEKRLSAARDSLAVNNTVARTRSHDSSSSDSTDSSSGTDVDTDMEGAMSRIATAVTGADVVVRTRTTHPVEISRTITHRLQQVGTVGASIRTRTNTKPIPPMGGGKPYPPDLPPYEDYVVEFDGPDDPLHPQNWPMKKKVFIGVILSYTALCSTFASSIFSASTMKISHLYHVGTTVATLSTSLYVLGYAFGPLIWGPFSELQGRKLPLLVAMSGFTLFCFACATSKDLQTLLICRYFSGLFGSAPLVIVAAIFADIFDNTLRGTAIVIFSSMVFLGPMMGPFIGGFVQLSYLDWRWNLYIPGIMGALAVILNFIFLKESYAPVVLVGKAAELRRRTKNWGIHAKQEEVEVDFKELVTKNFTRPLRLLITEPIILAVTIYMSFIYGLIYLFLTAYPLVFSGVHGWNAGLAGLPFFGMIIGIFIIASFIIYDSRNYNKKLAANNGIPVPEWRLPIVMVGGVFFSAGLFWFGWTGFKKEIPWIVPTLSGLFTGFGLLAIFIQCLNYLVDSYLMFAASALAANTFLRSVTAAGFPLFARQMFNGMGIEWASTLLGCFSACLVPIPILFYFQGKKLRSKSKFAPTMKGKPESDKSESEDVEHDMIALHATRTRATVETSLTGMRTSWRTRTRSRPNSQAINPNSNQGVDMEKGEEESNKF